jgi:hypothetical protein
MYIALCKWAIKNKFQDPLVKWNTNTPMNYFYLLFRQATLESSQNSFSSLTNFAKYPKYVPQHNEIRSDICRWCTERWRQARNGSDSKQMARRNRLWTEISLMNRDNDKSNHNKSICIHSEWFVARRTSQQSYQRTIKSQRLLLIDQNESLKLLKLILISRAVEQL